MANNMMFECCTQKDYSKQGGNASICNAAVYGKNNTNMEEELRIHAQRLQMERERDI